MKNMWKLKDMLCEQLEEYTSRTKLAGGDLQTVHMLTDTIKNLDKIEMLEDEEGGEYSHARRRRDSRGRYSRNGGYSGDMDEAYAYDDGDSYAGDYGGNMGGSRGGMGGNYSRRRGYSRADGKERMQEILEGMRDGVQGPEKQTVERMMEMLHKL